MLSIAGNVLLVAVLFTSLGAIILKGKVRFICFYLSSLFPIISLFLLVIGFSISDFSLKNVFLNSSSILPIIYKIAACWASHEGSILLWFSLLCIVGAVYIYLLDCSKEVREFGIIILAFIQILFCSFIIFSSNPFESFAFKPNEGLGLNPMLQDVALAIHPPLLYFGNVSYVAFFVGGCLLLYRPEDRDYLLLISKKFSSFALMTLTIGIGLGSWWAYRELGWGGYWFFDPVENISLMPWLSGIALHHFLIVSAKDGRFLRWTVFLSFMNFILVIFGTFFVRSGIVSSVHSFAFSPERGVYIFSICMAISLLSVVWFIIKQRDLVYTGRSMKSITIAILIGNSFWLAALVVLLIALIYPIYCSIIYSADIIIDPEYFTSVFIPIHLPILFLAAISPFLVRKLELKQLIVIVLTIIVVGILNNIVNFKIVSGLIAFASIYLMLQMLIYLVIESHFFTRSIAIKEYALFLGHFGFGLLVCSITFNTLLFKEVEFVGKVGDRFSNQGISVKLENMKFTDGVNYYRQIAIFQVEDKHNNIVTLKPENRLYKVENTLSQEVDIYSYLFHDLYAVLSQIDKDTIHAKIYYQPVISFIWLAVFIMFSGFLLLCCKNDKRL